MSVSSGASQPIIPLPWVCALVGILVTVMCYAIPQTTWAPKVGDGVLTGLRIIGGTIAMVLSIDEFLTKCVMAGLFFSGVVYSGVKGYRFQTTACIASLLGAVAICVLGILMFIDPGNPSRLMVHKVGALQALFEPDAFPYSEERFPAVDEKWISYYRCERVRKAYMGADAPFHLRFDLKVNGELVIDDVRCKRWDLNRVTLSRSHPV